MQKQSKDAQTLILKIVLPLVNMGDFLNTAFSDTAESLVVSGMLSQFTSSE